MSELRTLDQLRAAFDAEFQPATPSEGMLVMQLSTSTLRLEHLTPRALGDDKLEKELTKLEQHFQKTLRLLLRMQNARKKAHAAEHLAKAAESTEPIKLKLKKYHRSWPAPRPEHWENRPRAVEATTTPPER